MKADDSVRGKKASDWYRANPHRLHLGVVGFDFGKKATPANVHNIYQTLDLWNGEIRSSFQYNNKTFEVQTVCHPKLDMMSTRIQNMNKTPLLIRFPYPTGKHSDDACDWNSDNMHETEMVPIPSGAVLKRILDGTAYFVTIQWSGKVDMKRVGRNCFRLKPSSVDWSLSVKYSKTFPFETHVLPSFTETQKATAEHWHDFWTEGAAVDFSRCIDPRAKELERRVVLSQYLLAIQSAGSVPPQETGLTYNSWFGKFHLEMIYWHEAWLPLWGHGDMLRKALKWYKSAEPIARQIAERQGFKGVRWMKMTDPSGIEAPSNVGSFLIWQQPHLIQLAELVYQSYLSKDDYNGDEYRRDKANAFLHEYASFLHRKHSLLRPPSMHHSSCRIGTMDCRWLRNGGNVWVENLTSCGRTSLTICRRLPRTVTTSILLLKMLRILTPTSNTPPTTWQCLVLWASSLAITVSTEK